MKRIAYYISTIVLACIVSSFAYSQLSFSAAGGGKERLGYGYPTSEDITFANQLCLQAGLELVSVSISCVDGEVCILDVECSQD